MKLPYSKVKFSSSYAHRRKTTNPISNMNSIPVDVCDLSHYAPGQPKFESIREFATWFSSYRSDLLSTGLYRDVRASLDQGVMTDNSLQSILGRVILVPSTPSYTLGVTANQLGQPSFDASFFCPILSRLPIVISGTYNRSLFGSHVFDLSCKLATSPSMTSRIFSKVDDFSRFSDFTETKTGAEFRLSRNGQSAGIRHELREIQPCASQMRSGLSESQLTSLRCHIFYEYFIDRTRSFKNNPAFVCSGYESHLSFECPMALGDSDAAKFIISNHFLNRINKSVTFFNMFSLGIAHPLKPLLFSSRSKSGAPRISDRFFLGGTADPLTSVMGFAPRSVLPACGNQIGAQCFANQRFGINFSLRQDLKIRGSLFGQITTAFDSLSFSDASNSIRTSLGFAVAIPTSDKSTFIISSAFPVHKRNQDILQRIQFGFYFRNQQ